MALEPVELPAATIARHSGVSPTAMQVLLDCFRRYHDPERLPLVPPGSDDAYIRYTQALSRCRDYLGADFGSDKRCAMLGVLVRDWMRGYPLARLVAERIRFRQAGRDERQIARLIRDTMDDVEQVARFSAPKYLACYSAVHTVYLAEREQAPDRDGRSDAHARARRLRARAGRADGPRPVADRRDRAVGVHRGAHLRGRPMR